MDHQDKLLTAAQRSIELLNNHPAIVNPTANTHPVGDAVGDAVRAQYVAAMKVVTMFLNSASGPSTLSEHPVR